jgi:hypothetical protein
MKKILIIQFSLFLKISLFAQFTGNLAQPNIICNQTGIQKNVQVISDGNGGYYSFWLDDRKNPGTGTDNDVYGQHSDANGFPLWTANGKAIVKPAIKNVIDFKCTSTSNGIVIAWLMRNNGVGDSLMCKKIDSNGNDVWAQSTLISQNNATSILGSDVSGFNVFANDSGVTITHSVVFFGGSAGFTFNRVDAAGNLRWPMLSLLNTTLPGYDYRTCSDGQNGFYVLSKGNGIGSGLYINRFNLQGSKLWANSIDISIGGVYGFNINISLMVDNASNFYAIWDASNYKVVATKLTSQGNFAWASNQKLLTNTSLQAYGSYAIMRDNTIYCTWSVALSQFSLEGFVQKLDSSGNIAWTTNGVSLGIVNTNSIPSLGLSDSSAIILSYVGTSSSDVQVQRINPNGTLSWSANGQPISQGFGINNKRAIIVDDTLGCNAIFWEASLNYDIYATKICSNGTFVNLNTNESIDNNFTIYPNPANQFIFLNFKNKNTTSTIYLYNNLGQEVKKVSLSEQDNKIINIQDLPNGIYFIKCFSNDRMITQKIQIDN